MASNAAIAKQLLGRKPPPGEHSLLVLGLAGLSASAGVVHLSVVADHLREGIAFGLFFVALGAFQLGWALAALLRRRRHLYWVAAAVNTAVILIWVLSRTIGIPAGVPEPVGRADLFSTLVEAILVTGSLALLRPIGEAVSRKIGRAVLVVSVAAAPLTGLVSTSIAGETHVHHEDLPLTTIIKPLRMITITRFPLTTPSNAASVGMEWRTLDTSLSMSCSAAHRLCSAPT